MNCVICAKFGKSFVLGFICHQILSNHISSILFLIQCMRENSGRKLRKSPRDINSGSFDINCPSFDLSPANSFNFFKSQLLAPRWKKIRTQEDSAQRENCRSFGPKKIRPKYEKILPKMF